MHAAVRGGALLRGETFSVLKPVRCEFLQNSQGLRLFTSPLRMAEQLQAYLHMDTLTEAETAGLDLT